MDRQGKKTGAGPRHGDGQAKDAQLGNRLGGELDGIQKEIIGSKLLRVCVNGKVQLGGLPCPPTDVSALQRVIGSGLQGDQRKSLPAECHTKGTRRSVEGVELSLELQ